VEDIQETCEGFHLATVANVNASVG